MVPYIWCHLSQILIAVDVLWMTVPQSLQWPWVSEEWNCEQMAQVPRSKHPSSLGTLQTYADQRGTG